MQCSSGFRGWTGEDTASPKTLCSGAGRNYEVTLDVTAFGADGCGFFRLCYRVTTGCWLLSNAGTELPLDTEGNDDEFDGGKKRAGVWDRQRLLDRMGDYRAIA